MTGGFCEQVLWPRYQAQEPYHPRSCRLNEVRRLPSGDPHPPWVELRNEGGEPCDISGWCLRDGSGKTYVFPADLEPVPAKGVVLVVSGSPHEKLALKLSPEARECMIIYAGEELREFARGKENECALFCSAKPSKESLVDFVYWGGLSHTDQADWAVAARMWVRGEYDHKRFYNREWRDAPQGLDSIGRPPDIGTGAYPSKEADVVWPYWVPYYDVDATPGAPNPIPAPNPLCGDSILMEQLPSAILARHSHPSAGRHRCGLSQRHC